MLVCPVHTVHGDVDGYELRPRNPRYDMKRRKLRKREYLYGRNRRLYVVPETLQYKGQPLVDMLLTEAIHKANACAVWPDAQLFVTASCGVIGRGKNAFGGVGPLQDFDEISYKGTDEHGVPITRTVWLVPDSNFTTNPEVYEATIRNRAYLQGRGAQVHIVVIPKTPDGKDQGCDDWRAAHPNATFADLRALELGDDDPAAAAPPTYEKRPEGMYLNSARGEVQLTNFSASVIEDITKDDGVETAREFKVEITCNGRTTTLTVPSDGFDSLTWLRAKVGSGPQICPGNGIRDHARWALFTGPEPHMRRVYSHTGWADIQGVPQYLHAGGAVLGLPEIEVVLPPQLAAVNLPAASPEQIADGMRSSLELLDLAPDHIMVSLLSAVYRAALGYCDHGAYMYGPTGLFKTELALLMQQHYGAGFTIRELVSWTSTANAIEMVAFDAKNMLLVVDDLFSADAGFVEKQRQQAAADRVFRGSANGAGRARMNQKLEMRPTKPSRCLVLGTGEEAPRGQSLLARIWLIPVTKEDTGPGQTDLVRLTAAQKAGRDGQYARAMRGYLEWLTPKYDRISDGFKVRISEYRTRAGSELGACHARIPTMISSLFVGFDTFISAALEYNAISSAEAAAYRERAWCALITAGAEQSRAQASQEPAHRFLELVMAAIGSGRAYLESTPNRLDDAQTTALEGAPYYYGDPAKGSRIGWCNVDNVYLDPIASYKAAREMAPGDSGFTTDLETLKRLLKNQGLLASTDVNHQTVCVQKTLASRRQPVLHFRPTAFGWSEAGITPGRVVGAEEKAAAPDSK